MRQKALEYAMWHLSLKMHTCKQIREKLQKKGYDEEVIDDVIDALKQEKFLDDKNYAFLYITDSINLGNKGLFRIKQELYQKGLNRDIIEEVIDENDFDTSDNLKNLIRAKIGNEVITNYKEMQKLKNQLIRKGYNYRDINNCLSELGVKVVEEDYGSYWDDNC